MVGSVWRCAGPPRRGCEDHERVPANKVRRTLSLSGKTASLPPFLLETMFKIKADAFFLGESCIKRGPTKGKCDLCYYLLGRLCLLASSVL